jgi:predicted phosphodiesterase
MVSSMRYLVLSDIHANIRAFEAVLQCADRHAYDAVLFLGDIVGYGNEPEECIQLLKSLKPVMCLQGNHDVLLLSVPEHEAGREPLRKRPLGVVEWVIKRHAGEVSADSRAFLQGFAESFVARDWQAVHGGLRRRWEYISSLNAAQSNAPFLERGLCLVGHTHVPVVHASVSTADGDLWRSISFRQDSSTLYRLPPSIRAFFNPGSVGQPRDGLPQASFGVFDTDRRTVEVHRVDYDVAGVQASLRADGYPEVLAARLTHGT